MGNKTITKGFIATKGDQTFEIKVEIYELGFYIYKYENGKILDQTARKQEQIVENIIHNNRISLEAKGYSIKEHGLHKIKFNSKTLKYKTSI